MASNCHLLFLECWCVVFTFLLCFFLVFYHGYFIFSQITPLCITWQIIQTPPPLPSAEEVAMAELQHQQKLQQAKMQQQFESQQREQQVKYL